MKSEGGALAVAESNAQELASTTVRLAEYEERMATLEERLSEVPRLGVLTAL